MIITKSWLQEWVDVSDKSGADIALRLNQIGLEVESLTSYRVPQNVVVGFVLSCEKHPDAQKLSVCTVDVGTGVRQIVCGASNVREGIFVAVAMIGAELSNGMNIKPVKLRGVESDGMICSATEIDLPPMGDGILILDDSIGVLKAGTPLTEYEVLNDDVIAIELTANRGDCLGHKGIARDLGAAFGRALTKQEIKDSDYRRQGAGRVMHLTHQNDIQVDVIYKSFDYGTLVLPLKLRYRLQLTQELYTDPLEGVLRYAMIATGVLLRAYSHRFFVRNESEIAEITLYENSDGVVCVGSGNAEALPITASMVGIAKNEATKVTTSAERVIIEASYIAPEKIAKQVYALGLKTDELYSRASRGSDPDVGLGIKYCADILMRYCKVEIIPGTFEYLSVPIETTLNLDVCSMTALIGDEVDKVKIVKVLSALGFEIVKSQEDNIVVNPPRFRHDITREQDVVEEIVRMIGIDNIHAKPLAFVEQPTQNSAYNSYSFKRTVRQKAADAGFFEAITYLFGSKERAVALGFESVQSQVALLNPIVETMDCMRPSILMGLLEAASSNKKVGRKSIALFEYGAIFDAHLAESTQLMLLFSGDSALESPLNQGRPAPIDFGAFVAKIGRVIGEVAFEPLGHTALFMHPFQAAKLFVNSSHVGEVFKLHPTVAQQYDLEDTYIAQIVMDGFVWQRPTVAPYSRYQAAERDISIVVPQNYLYSDIKNCVDTLNLDYLQCFYLIDSYRDAKMQAQESITLRFVLQSMERTLTEEDIAGHMQAIIDALDTQLGYKLR